ncbi:MAG: methyltransferase [Clostridia bacterium]|nr:methyltransferase [Clostridia bacterium]
MTDLKQEFLGIYNIFCSNIHRFGTDAVLLEYFSNSKRAKFACDLGCGCGIIPFLMLQSNPNLKITAIDIQKDAIELVNRAIEFNGVADKITPINCDLKALPKEFNGKFDLVTMNPPYKRKGSGKTTGVYGIDIARNEIECTLEDICKAASKLLIPNGRFCICQRPERFGEVIFEMKRAGIEPKQIRNVVNKAGDKPMLVLVSGIKGGNCSTEMLPDLILKTNDDSDSEEVKEIYKIMRGKTNG